MQLITFKVSLYLCSQLDLQTWEDPPQLSSAVTDRNVTNQNHMEQYQNHAQTMGISH